MVKRCFLNFVTLSARRRNFVSRKVAAVCRNYIDVYENCSWHYFENGEEYILSRLSGSGLRTIFDVGAHHGTWTRMALDRLPASNVHAFEIAGPTAHKLTETVKDESSRVTVNRVGLGRRSDILPIIYFPKRDDNTSVRVKHGVYKNDGFSVDARVISGDEYCKLRNIREIDFCKIDVEGHEFDVLAGFKTMIAERRIRIIQFEHVRETSIVRNHTLEDIFSFLKEYDYTIGRLFRHGVIDQEYDESLEVLRSANYVAIPYDENELNHAVQYE